MPPVPCSAFGRESCTSFNEHATDAHAEPNETSHIRNWCSEGRLSCATSLGFGTKSVALLGPRKVRERLMKIVAEQGLEIALERQR